MTRLILSTLIALALGVASTAAQRAAATAKPGTAETPHLTITTSSSIATVAGGSRVSLLAAVVLKPKMHVYAPEQNVYLPVSLRLDRAPGVTSRPAIFPKGEPFFFAPLSETQIVYSQPFRIELPVTIARGRPAGPLTLTGTLEYQACDDRVCYVPRKVPVAWALTIR